MELNGLHSICVCVANGCDLCSSTSDGGKIRKIDHKGILLEANFCRRHSVLEDVC